MKIKSLRLLSLLLAALMLLMPVACGKEPADAETTPAGSLESEVPVEPVKDSGVTYVFSGEDADRPGYAEGVIEIAWADEAVGSSYVLCYADDEGILADYKPIAVLPVTGEAVTYEMRRKMALPEEATQIAVFVSDDGSVPADASLSDARLVTIPAEKRFASGAVELRFASLSDLHLNYDYAVDKWRAILEYFKEIELPLIAISGDYSEDGGEEHLSAFGETVKEVGYEGTIWTAMGNHDTGNRENWIRDFADFGSDGENEYFYRIAPNGDVFIFMSLDNLKEYANVNREDNFTDEELDWLEGLLKQYSNTGVNIFIYEHANFYNWGAGDIKPGIYVEPMVVGQSFKSHTRLMAILTEYKEAVFCTGHTHVAFSENVNFNDENGSAARMIHNSSTSQPRTVNEDRTGYVYDTNPINSEGYLCAVYENDIVYRGMDFSTHTFIPEACLIIESYSADHSDTDGLVSITVDKNASTTSCPDGTSRGDLVFSVIAEFEDGTTRPVDDFSFVLVGETTVVRDKVRTILANQETATTGTTGVIISWGGKTVNYSFKVKRAAN